MAHGDYTRIALPPSESYACPTVSMVQMRQAGLSDDEIIDTLHNDDPVSGYSPSVLGEAELRELATQNLDTIDDMFSVLQTQSPNEDCRKKAVSDDFSNAGSNDPFPQGSSLCPRSHAASDDHPPKEDSTGKVQMAIEKGILHQIPWTSMQTGQYQGLHASSRAHLQPAAPAQDVAAAVSRLEPAPSDSFTDEFLQAIRAANEAANDAPEFPQQEPDLPTQSEFIQELWELWTAHATLGPGFIEPLGKIESWYTDHVRHLRCTSPRVVVLPREYSSWEGLIMREWRDVALPHAETSFHLVYPQPEDGATGVFAQIVVVQQPVELSRSVVLSVYDSASAVQRPYSFCQVLPARLGNEEVLDATGRQRFVRTLFRRTNALFGTERRQLEEGRKFLFAAAMRFGSVSEEVLR